MNYYYDINLNFLDINSYFYDWLAKDEITYIKKIPIFQVNKKTFSDFYINQVKVSQEFLALIENKTLKAKTKIKYACILVNKNAAYAYRFNDEGLINGRSSLKLIDELNILEYIYSLTMKNIKYDILKKLPLNNNPRHITNIIDLINAEIEKMYNEKNLAKMKYLYLEWFNKNSDDLDLIYKEMKEKLKADFDESNLKIYDLIKLSYKNV